MSPPVAEGAMTTNPSDLTERGAQRSLMYAQAILTTETHISMTISNTAQRLSDIFC